MPNRKTQTDLNLLKLLLSTLEENKLIKAVQSNSTFFHDEPKFYQYGASLNFIKDYSDGLKIKENITGSGSSFNSKYKALLKCLGESIERLSLYCFLKKNIIFSSRDNLKEEALDLSVYSHSDTINSIKLGWAKGYNLIKNIPCFIPAQLVYLNFCKTYKEVPLSSIISTGAAGGFSHEETLLRGIYEVVERDAFMTTYLNKIKVPRIDIEKIKNHTIKLVIESCHRYNLELLLFNIASDLKIPSFMAIIIDRTGSGPAISIGTKSSLDEKNAVFGSIDEAIKGRKFMRSKLIRLVKNKINKFNIEPNRIRTLQERGLFWLSSNMINKLDFWLMQEPTAYFKINTFKVNRSQELSIIKNILIKKGFDIYYADITPSIFKSTNYLVYKVIIPNLQPLYLDETKKELRLERIKAAAGYFGRKNYKINPVPHPFL